MNIPGRVYKRKGSKYWQIAYYGPKDGQIIEIRESSRSTKKKDAVELLRARLDEVAAHRGGHRQFGGPAQDRVTVADILDAVRRKYEVKEQPALPQLKTHIRHLLDYFTNTRALAVNRPMIMAYIAHRKDDGMADGTINREVGALRKAFNLAVESGVLSMAPKFPPLREDNARQGFFERGEFDAVVANLKDPGVIALCCWAYWSGMRTKEIKSLTWADYDKETGTLRLQAKNTKTGKGRVLPVVGNLAPIMERRIKARRMDSPYVSTGMERKSRTLGGSGSQPVKMREYQTSVPMISGELLLGICPGRERLRL